MIRVRAVVAAGLVNAATLAKAAGLFPRWRIDLLLYDNQVLGYDELLKLEQALDKLKLPYMPGR